MDGAESLRCVCRICRSYDLSLNWNEELDEFVRMTYKDCFYKYTSFPEMGGNLLSEFLCEDCATGVKNFHLLVKKSMETFKLCELQFDNVNPTSSGFADEICSTVSSKEKCIPTEYSIKLSDDNMDNIEDGIIASGDNDVLRSSKNSLFEDVILNEKQEEDLEENHDQILSFEKCTFTTLGDDVAKEQSDDSDDIHKIECVDFVENDAILCEEIGSRSPTAQTKNGGRLLKGKGDPSNPNHILLDFDDKPSSKGGKTPAMCSYCSKIVHNIYYLKQHEQTHKENRTREVSCPTCGLKLFNKQGLYVHMKTHEKNRVKRFKCEFCDKAFFNRGACNVHRRIHLGQMTQCPLCPKQFYRQVELDRHMPSHSHESLNSGNRAKPKKYYVHCKECGKKVQSDRFNAHRAVHMNDPFMRCTVCEKDFFCRISGGRHMSRVHKRKGGHYDDITFYYKTKIRPRLSFLIMSQQEDMEPVS